MADNRQQKRFIRRLNADFIVDGITRKGVSSNFSLNGLFIRTNYPYALETILDIVVYLSDGKSAKIKGKVKRSSKTSMVRGMDTSVGSMKNGMGINILENDANYLHLIRDLLD